MSTRATIHFCYEKDAEAIIYRHGDGYPEGLGEDLKEFFNEVDKLNDKRFDDPQYLAAKWVVWDSQKHNRSSNPLDFLSVGIVLKDPSDIEYRYLIDCSINTNGKPTITIEEI